jgi:hypothetical protein
MIRPPMPNLLEFESWTSREGTEGPLSSQFLLTFSLLGMTPYDTLVEWEDRLAFNGSLFLPRRRYILTPVPPELEPPSEDKEPT